MPNSRRTEEKRLAAVESHDSLLNASGKAWPCTYAGSESYCSTTARNKAEIKARQELRAQQLAEFNGGICVQCGKPWDSHAFLPCGWLPNQPDPIDREPIYVLTKSRDYGQKKCKQCKKVFSSRAPTMIYCPECGQIRNSNRNKKRKRS